MFFRPKAWTDVAGGGAQVAQRPKRHPRNPNPHQPHPEGVLGTPALITRSPTSVGPLSLPPTLPLSHPPALPLSHARTLALSLSRSLALPTHIHARPRDERRPRHH